MSVDAGTDAGTDGGTGCGVCTGCCSGSTCVLAGNETFFQCGGAGTACQTCASRQLCQSNACVAVTAGIHVTSSGSPMPPVWIQPNAQPFGPKGNGAANAYVAELVQVDATVTTSDGGASDPQCPLPFTSAGGTKYCDGFDIKDSSSNFAVVDAFAYLGSSGESACGLPPPDGTQYPMVTGIWEDDYNTQTGVDTWVLSVATCAGAGGGAPDAGNTQAPPATTDIHALLDAGVVVGEGAQVRGVVIGRWLATTSTSYGFAMEDPLGGPRSGIHVYNPPDGGLAQTTAPNIGDYVQVTGTLNIFPTDGGPSWPELDL
jgi:hypothetical protein